MPCQKTMLLQIEWVVQSATATKNGVLPVTSFFDDQLPKCPNLHFL